MKYSTVCSGIGSPESAWSPFGWKQVFCSEIELFPNAVLKTHYPDVPNYGDMTKYKEWPNYGTVELICGGTPCQSFSVAGLRKGLDDPRGNLTLVFLGILLKYRPRWMVWENVPGVLSDKTGAFGAFLGGLGKLGYGFAYRILDAQYAGVPQRRRRVFVVGYFGDWRRAAAVLFERHSLQRNSPPSRKAGEEITGTIGARTKAGGGLGTGFECSGGLTVHSLRGEGFDASEDGTGRGTPIIVHGTQDPCTSETAFALGRNNGQENAVAMATGQANAEILSDLCPTLNCDHEVPICFKGGQGSSSRSLGIGVDCSPCLTSAESGGNRVPVVALQSVNTPRNKKQNGIGVSESDIMYTCTAKDQHEIFSGTQVRRLTPRECERLQGFPDDYSLVKYRGKPAKDGPRYKAIGNSMAVPVMRWIGERIEMVEKIK